MSALLLHIGQPKTGTSFIQASLRLSRAALAAHGIVYPARDDPGEARPEAITSGNAQYLLRDEATFARELAAHRGAAEADHLFSSEHLMNELALLPDLAALPRVAGAAGFQRVRILLFIRDPIANLSSESQQLIKRGGATETVDAYAELYDKPERIAHLLDRLAALENVEITVRNYGVCRDRLLDEVADWAGLPAGVLTDPGVARVNRSMTRAELELQRALNRVVSDGRSRMALSDALCERLPGIRPDVILPSLVAQEAALARLAPAMARVDAHAPPEHRYKRDIQTPSVFDEDLRFTPAQIEVTAEALGGEIEQLRHRLAKAERDPAVRFGARRLLEALVQRATMRLGGKLGRGPRPAASSLPRTDGRTA